MLPASTILENCSFGAGSDMTLLEYIFQVGTRWTEFFPTCTELMYCFKKIERNTQGPTNEGMNMF